MRKIHILAAALFVASLLPARAADNVKIGVIYPLSGNSATAGNYSKMAIEVGADVINNGNAELAKIMPLAKGGGLTCPHDPEAEQNAPAEHDGARPEPIGERAPRERGDAHAEVVEERRRRDIGARPAHRFGHGLKKDAEREHRAEPDTGDDDAGAHDDPAVEELHRASVP